MSPIQIQYTNLSDIYTEQIQYTGIGANPSGIHTTEQFLAIMHQEFTFKDWSNTCFWYPQLNFKDWILPNDFIFFNLDDWIEYSGAIKI